MPKKQNISKPAKASKPRAVKVDGTSLIKRLEKLASASKVHPETKDVTDTAADAHTTIIQELQSLNETLVRAAEEDCQVSSAARKILSEARTKTADQLVKEVADRAYDLKVEQDKIFAAQDAEHVKRMHIQAKKITDRLKEMGFTPELTPGALWEIMHQENLGFVIKHVASKPAASAEPSK